MRPFSPIDPSNRRFAPEFGLEGDCHRSLLSNRRLAEHTKRFDELALANSDVCSALHFGIVFWVT